MKARLLWINARKVIEDMINEENVLLQERQAARTSGANKAISTITIGVILSVLILLLVGTLITLSITRPLK